ncbi:maleylpyruvate isomerase family mycothiol-dependent enzyme [Microbacterium sp. NPDC077644]|uniref:maleylpyruvate isomerase family mycothiol-dependent enzyme n=1 Tax=Microbacterium sp. NPDC077644 TaxID=3155055 RepID=UPI00344CD007
MTKHAPARYDSVAGLRASVGDVVALVETLTPDEWKLPSACAGWRVQDLVVHLTQGIEFGLRELNPDRLSLADDIEQLNEIVVSARRDWSSQQVRDAFLTSAGPGLEALVDLVDPPRCDEEYSMGSAGRHRLAVIPAAVCFDFTVHLHYDLRQPRGPLARPGYELDAVRLGPTLDWMFAGLNAMSGPAVAHALSAPITLALDGPGARSITFSVGSDPDRPVTQSGVASATVVSSTTRDFVGWSTRRRPWEGAVSIDGDAEHAYRFLRALHIF